MRLGKGKWLLILGAFLVVVDQVIKVLVKTNMSIGEHINVFGDWFQILFIENKGMAFGMSFGGVIGKYALTAFRIVLFAFLTVWISRLLKRGSGADKRTPVPTGVLVGLTLITAGALGNIIDCLFYGLVFTESAPGVVWPDWVPLVGGDIFFEPVFNFADSCVTVGAIYLILFQWRFFSKEE